MSIIQMILRWHEETHQQINNAALYAAFPLFNKSSIRSALSRHRKKIRNEMPKNYRGFLHAKRIQETISDKPKKAYDLDIEMTIAGIADIRIPAEKINDVVNPILLKKTLEMLYLEGIYLDDRLTNVKVTGHEWTSMLYQNYSPIWTIEVIMVNNSGNRYVFSGDVIIEESEFN